MGKGGGSPPPAPTQTQVVRSEIPEFFRPFLEDVFRRSSAISEEAYIPPPEWEIATFLPVAQWQKGTMGQVYKDSRRIMNA